MGPFGRPSFRRGGRACVTGTADRGSIGPWMWESTGFRRFPAASVVAIQSQTLSIETFIGQSPTLQSGPSHRRTAKIPSLIVIRSVPRRSFFPLANLRTLSSTSLHHPTPQNGGFRDLPNPPRQVRSSFLYRNDGCNARLILRNRKTVADMRARKWRISFRRPSAFPSSTFDWKELKV